MLESRLSLPRASIAVTLKYQVPEYRFSTRKVVTVELSIGSTVVIRYRFQDLRSGDILVERPRFVYQTSYIPPVGETFSIAMTRALDGMAELVVETMETDW